MLTLNVNTKIAAILKEHPDALETIVSISPKFSKLRNPLLRKLMASRTTIGMASKIGGCSVNDFFDKLQPLGFSIDKTVVAEESRQEVPLPDFMKNLRAENIVELDVRADIETGKDPLSLILGKTRQLAPHQTLKLINSFEPIPLIQLLGKQGYETYSETINDNLVYTYFFKTAAVKKQEPQIKSDNADWDTLLKKFREKLKTIDVRPLEMPLPMLTILDELEKLPQGNALFVYHKRIPVFLLPELQERKFEYRIKEVSDGEVYLLIFHS